MSFLYLVDFAKACMSFLLLFCLLAAFIVYVSQMSRLGGGHTLLGPWIPSGSAALGLVMVQIGIMGCFRGFWIRIWSPEVFPLYLPVLTSSCSVAWFMIMGSFMIVGIMILTP